MGPRPGTQALPRFPHSGAEAMPRPKPLLELVVRSFVHMDRGHTEGEQHNKRRSHCGRRRRYARRKVFYRRYVGRHEGYIGRKTCSDPITGRP